MAFPTGLMDIDVELDLDGDGTYETDISAYAMVRNSSGSISIRRGKQSEGGQTEADSCSIELDNRDGRFSPRNPLGAYYGSLVRNTGIQVSVHAGDRYLRIPETSGAYVSTPDAAVLDITGDIDVRIDVTYDEWENNSRELCGKRAGAGQISWYMLKNSGNGISFAWSANGTTLLFYDGAEFIPQRPDRRIALRATLDVDNGLGGYTVTYYYAPTIDGPWTQFDQQVTTSGTTSIFNSTAPVEVGQLNDAVSNPTNGNFHKFELYNGIGGTLVANPDFRIQTAGATSFADTTSSPRTWTLQGTSSISDKKVRFTGEVSEWPVEWDPSGNDIYSRITAAGVLRRLEAGNRPVHSTLRRALPSAANLIAYWPMEENDGATRFSSPISGVRHLQQSGWDMAEAEGPRGSDRLPVIRTGAYINGLAPAPASASTEWHFECLFNLPTAPASNVTIIRPAGSGTARYWELMLRTGFFHVNAVDVDGTILENLDFAITDGDVFDEDNRLQLFAVQNGGNVDWQARIININGSTVLDTGTQSFAGSVGRISGITGGQPVYGTGADGMYIGHIGVFSDADTTAYNFIDHGFNGETAIARIVRLANEEDFAFEALDWDVENGSEALGSQPIDTLLNILREAEESDHGILCQARDFFRLKYVDRGSIVNQPVLTTLDYTTDLMPGIKPVDDDRPLGNQFVVVNRYGADATAELTTGSLSTQSPPNGVGIYPQSSNVNLTDDSRSDDHANWLVHQHTYDEARFPVINISMFAASDVAEDVIRLDIGHRFQIENIPAKLLYNDLDLLLEGYEEQIHQRYWDITLHCAPAGPWSVGIVGDEEQGRADTDGSELSAAVNSSATTFDVFAHTGNTWVKDSGEYPFDLAVGGERVTATAGTNRAADDFSDTQTDTWGSADIGGTWTNSGGAASDYDKTGGLGTHTHTSAGVSRRSSLDLNLDDAEVVADFQTAALATGGPLYAAVMLRYTDIDNLYMANLAFGTTGVITLQILERVAGVETLLSSTYTSAHTHAINTSYRVRFQANGTTLRAKMWLASKPEGNFWQVTATDSSLTTGDIGVRTMRDAANTNANAVIRTDNFAVENPTRMTVTRSVNGVVKSHSAGTDVKLWTPTIVSL